MINNILKKIEKANEVQRAELAKHDVELAIIDDINKLKQQITSSWKSHVAKRDAWGAESSKILQSP